MQQTTRCKINKFNLKRDFQDFTITTSELTFLKIGQMLLLTFLKWVTLWLFLVKFVFNQWDKDQYKVEQIYMEEATMDWVMAFWFLGE